MLKDDYNYDSTVRIFSLPSPGLFEFDLGLLQPSFYALHRSFTKCLFIEDEGEIVFYKDKHGNAVRELDPAYVEEMKRRSLESEAGSALEMEHLKSS